MRLYSRGYSLVELLVVIAIISILAGIAFFSFSQGSAISRDADRKADLRTVQSALELYYQDNGRYPDGCNTAGNWSGQIGSSVACASGNQYITGLAPKYIPTLPVDPKLNGSNSGYMYVTNSNGSVYKFMIKNTVETETVTVGHDFQSCDLSGLAWTSCSESDILPAISVPLDRCDAATCDRTHPSYNPPNHCTASNAQFRSSYAVWGGYAYVDPSSSNHDLLVERYTEDIICDRP